MGDILMFGKLKHNPDGSYKLCFEDTKNQPLPSSGLWIPTKSKTPKNKNKQSKKPIPWLTTKTMIGFGLTTVAAFAGISYFYLRKRSRTEEIGEETDRKEERERILL